LGVVPRTGAGLSKLFDRVGFYLVRGRIICFDDIERHGRQLDLRDFLGLVSYLSEQRDCRVVVILNDGQLDAGDQTTWESYREKVFQGEVNYSPTPEETIELGLEKDVSERWHASLRASLLELGISNIRLVRRSADFMKLAEDAIGGRTLRQETMDGMSRTVAMLVFSLHGRGAGGPPLERVKNAGRLDMAVYQGQREDTRSGQERDWDALISRYRLYLHSALDAALELMVKRGFPEGQALRKAIEEIESDNELNQRKRDWHRAWRLYHDTVSDNGAEIISAFEKTWPGVAAHEHPTNLQSAARMVRMLGRPDLASNFIRTWIDHRSGERVGELESHQLHMFDRVSDPEILEAVEVAKGRAAQTLSLQDAFDMFRATNGYPEKAIASFAEASVDEIVRFIDATVSEDMAGVLRRILELRSNHADPNWVGASQNVQHACELIAARSALAADRMRNWFAIEAPAE